MLASVDLGQTVDIAYLATCSLVIITRLNAMADCRSDRFTEHRSDIIGL